MFDKFDKEEKKKVLISLIRDTEETELNFTGGTHIIFEDGNYRKSDIEFCKEESIKQESLKCFLICCLLECFNEYEIKEIVEDPKTYYDFY